MSVSEVESCANVFLMPRGRNRSPAALSTISVVVPGQGRPEPPPELDAVEAKAWREVIAALPAHWIDLAGQLILLRLAAQAAVAARLEEQMRQMRAADMDQSKEAKVLAARHTLAAKSVADLLGQLRATPKSRTVARAAGPRVLQGAPELRPWEIKGGGKAEAEAN
jgi:hypothetical protein